MTAAVLNLFDQFIAQASAEHKEWIERAAAMARAMVEEGEPDIAVENFCENLIEWQCPLSRTLYDALEHQALALGVDRGVVSALQPLIK